MNQAQQIIPRLRRLVDLEAAQRQIKKDRSASEALAAEIEALRALLPTSILSHHDSRRARGKRSVAPVTRGICGACHLALPRGRFAELRRVADALSVCDHCGVFTYLADEEPPLTAVLPAATTPPRKKAPSVKRTPRQVTAGESASARP